VTPNGCPRRDGGNNQYARGDRKYHSRSALAVLPLKLQEIAVAWAAGGQMVQVRLCLGQRHLVRGNGGDNLAARASDALGIRELVLKSATQYA
jgi:hypothetical protein